MAGEMVRVSVVIPVYNGQDTLPSCLRALLNQSRMPDEIIVVDDGSTDDTCQVVGKLGVRCITQPNQGPAAARNRGVKATRGDIILFTDADCEPCPEWTDRLLRCFERQDVVAAKGIYCTQQSGMVPRFVQQEYEYKYGRMSRQVTIDFIDTYAAAYRRNVFVDNGGFDERFRVPSVEDQEFSFRLARKGYQMAFVPDAVVMHQHDRSVSEYVRRKFRIGYWKAYMLRWLPEKAFHDSHTPPSQRWQILMVLFFSLSLVAMAFWPTAIYLAVACALAFYASALPMLLQIAHRDRPILVIAPFLLLCRAIALAAGLAAGIILPPRESCHN